MLTLDVWRFEIWWACHVRPFWSAQQRIEIAAESEFQAVSVLLSRTIDGPFTTPYCIHCHIVDWRLIP